MICKIVSPSVISGVPKGAFWGGGPRRAPPARAAGVLEKGRVFDMPAVVVTIEWLVLQDSDNACSVYGCSLVLELI
jgi:hypothetical protein